METNFNRFRGCTSHSLVIICTLTIKGLNMDISALPIPQLRELQSKIDAELKKRIEDEKNNARREILAIAEKAGLQLKDIVGGSLKIKTTATVPIKYRDPSDSNNTWTGRGRQPKWFKTYIDAGSTPESLSV